MIMTIHKRCHGKSTPLIFASTNLSLLFLGFPHLKHYAFSCHMELDEKKSVLKFLHYFSIC
jgi:hypothetical protein